MWRAAVLLLVCGAALTTIRAQPERTGLVFEVASVKASKLILGRDGSITTDPSRLIARNTTLKRLIFEAWQIPYTQISGGPAWLNNDEYDVEGKASAAASLPQLRVMLRALLQDRFKLSVRNEKREGRVYALTLDKGGPKLPQTGSARTSTGWRFHGDLSEFASVLAIQLTIPLLEDPTKPSRATGPPRPVVDKTGVNGVYDLDLDLKPDQGGDPFNVWQRALKEQLGLKLQSQTASIDYLIVEHVERIPIGN